MSRINGISTIQFLRLPIGIEIDIFVFNYSEQEQTTVLSLERMGLDRARSYQVRELWSGNESTAKGELEVRVPSKDVQLLEFK